MHRPSKSGGIGTEPGMGQDGERAPSRAGQVLSGKYRLIHVLGEGNMGVVWLAEHLALRAPVALKLMLPFGEREADARARFLREARIASAVRSAHVVQVLDYGVDMSAPYIVMERLEGESLAARLERVGSLAPDETVRVVTHVSRALERARELGVVHRDLKPHNIFIADEGDEEIIKVLDFGIAIQAGEAPPDSSAPGVFVGTPQYMSPEQAECAAGVDGRTDIWALGVVAFECLIGHPPFMGGSLEQILAAVQTAALPVPSSRAHVPKAFDAWFQRACARDPARRFSSARAAARELEKSFAADDERPRDCPRAVATLCARIFSRSRGAAG